MPANKFLFDSNFERFLTFLKADVEEVPRGTMEETDGQHPRAAREVEAA